MLKERLAKFETFKNISTLLSGSVMAQLILLAATPVLTRIYSPADFGVLAIFIALLSIIGVIANGRYELAITQAETQQDCQALVVLAVIFSVFIACLSCVLVLLFEAKILDIVGNNAVQGWLYVLPISIVLMGVFQSFNYWNIRDKKYSNISIAKVNQSFSNVAANFSLAKIQIPGFGLLIGYLFGQIVLVLGLIYRTSKSVKRLNITGTMLKKVALRYIKFPLYSMPGALLNSAALQLPIFFISRFYDAASVGFFHFIIRIIGGPLSLISFSISQVFLQKLSSNSPESIAKFIGNALLFLTIVAIAFVSILYFFGEPLIVYVFGPDWQVAGEYVKVLVFSLGIRFIVSPLSVILTLDRFLHIGVLWQLYSFLSVLFVSIATAHLPIMDFLMYFVLQDILSYCLYLVLIIFASKKYKG